MLAETTAWTTLAWLVASGLVMIWAATHLTQAAEQIATSTGIGQYWVGAMLLAAATSLPELAVDVTAVRLGASNLAAGDLFGSGMANMLILALLLLFRGSVATCWRFGHELSRTVGLALVMTALAAMAVLLRAQTVWFGLSPVSLLLVGIYLMWTRSAFQQDAADIGDAPTERTSPPRGSWRWPVGRFGLAALAIFSSAPLFAAAAHRLAVLSGLGDTTVGTIMVGVSTSLPELTVSLAALRMGASSLAVGNLFGSNAFNMLVFFAMDCADRGSIFAALDPTHVLSALGATLLMGLGLVAVLRPPSSRLALLEPSGLSMIAVYVAIMTTVLLHTSSTG